MAKAAAKPENIFELSFRGGLPDLLRALADQIEAEQVTTDHFEWTLNHDHLVFTAKLGFKS